MTNPTNQELTVWQDLLTHAHQKWQPLFDAAKKCDPTDVAAITKLRKLAPLEYVRIVVEIQKARTKASARHKFSAVIADQLVTDAAGLEMASSAFVAHHKAQRFHQHLPDQNTPTTIHDLCSGIGADTMAFTNTLDPAHQVIAVDQNPLRTWMTSQNARINNPHSNLQAQTADVTELNLDKITYFHLDPSRRAESKNDQRAWCYADYQPGPDFIQSLIDHPQRSGAIKLGPGINIPDLQLHTLKNTPPPEIEFIAENPNQRLTQAILWTGKFVNQNSFPTRRATILPENLTLVSTTNHPDHPPIAEQNLQYLHTFNPAPERAQPLTELCALLGLPLIHPQLGLLTSDTLQPHQSNPWLTASFELLAELPFHERLIKKYLRQNDAGIVEIKTRNQTVNPDQLQKQLRGDGQTPYTIFILRFDSKIKTLITKRCP